jgi:hypothetical protein
LSIVCLPRMRQASATASFYWMGVGNVGIAPRSALQLFVSCAGILFNKKCSQEGNLKMKRNA